ncbi:hypothetical protein RRG08_056528 [Elysia crispata]|uniref:Fibronectin type-III domain-containing protein n=1 Tax=Elysia crispata TaxID=231223 RepID=A0AAE1DI24_9GAST|nr:hypothetical protein RRG08_056528 [Elysia crispata]
MQTRSIDCYVKDGGRYAASIVILCFSVLPTLRSDPKSPAPGSPPLNVRARADTENTIIVTWEKPVITNGQLTLSKPESRHVPGMVTNSPTLRLGSLALALACKQSYKRRQTYRPVYGLTNSPTLRLGSLALALACKQSYKRRQTYRPVCGFDQLAHPLTRC